MEAGTISCKFCRCRMRVDGQLDKMTRHARTHEVFSDRELWLAINLLTPAEVETLVARVMPRVEAIVRDGVLEDSLNIFVTETQEEIDHPTADGTEELEAIQNILQGENDSSSETDEDEDNDDDGDGDNDNDKGQNKVREWLAQMESRYTRAAVNVKRLKPKDYEPKEKSEEVTEAEANEKQQKMIMNWLDSDSDDELAVDKSVEDVAPQKNVETVLKSVPTKNAANTRAKRQNKRPRLDQPLNPCRKEAGSSEGVDTVDDFISSLQSQRQFGRK